MRFYKILFCILEPKLFLHLPAYERTDTRAYQFMYQLGGGDWGGEGELPPLLPPLPAAMYGNVAYNASRMCFDYIQ